MEPWAYLAIIQCFNNNIKQKFFVTQVSLHICKHTIDAIFAAKAADVVNEVKKVAFPAVFMVYRVLSLALVTWSACLNTLMNTNTSSTPEDICQQYINYYTKNQEKIYHIRDLLSLGNKTYSKYVYSY